MNCQCVAAATGFGLALSCYATVVEVAHQTLHVAMPPAAGAECIYTRPYRIVSYNDTGRGDDPQASAGSPCRMR